MEEADAIRIQANDDANRTKDGASVYAEQLLANLEQNLAQMQEIVKNGQVQLERRRIEAEEQLRNSYNSQNYEEFVGA